VLDDDDGELMKVKKKKCICMTRIWKVLLSVSVSHVDSLDVSNGLSIRVRFWSCGRGVEDIVSLHIHAQ
jgi:hypothetical protein